MPPIRSARVSSDRDPRSLAAGPPYTHRATYTSNQLDKLATFLKSTHVARAPGYDPYWREKAVNFEALKCKDDDNPQHLAYIVALDILHRQVRHLPPPHHSPGPKVVEALRRRLQPGATRREGNDRCYACIERKGGWHSWIGCWKGRPGEACAACLANCCGGEDTCNCTFENDTDGDEDVEDEDGLHYRMSDGEASELAMLDAAYDYDSTLDVIHSSEESDCRDDTSVAGPGSSSHSAPSRSPASNTCPALFASNQDGADVQRKSSDGDHVNDSPVAVVSHDDTTIDTTIKLEQNEREPVAWAAYTSIVVLWATIFDLIAVALKLENNGAVVDRLVVRAATLEKVISAFADDPHATLQEQNYRLRLSRDWGRVYRDLVLSRLRLGDPSTTKQLVARAASFHNLICQLAAAHGLEMDTLLTATS